LAGEAPTGRRQQRGPAYLTAGQTGVWQGRFKSFPAERPLRIEPAGRPSDWLKLVHEPLRERELAAIRRSVNRATPLGEDNWGQRLAATLGLAHTLRPRRRPRKGPQK